MTSKNLDLERRAYSVTETAKLFGVSKSTIWRMVSDGKIKAIAGFTPTRISVAEIERILKEGNIEA